MTHHLTISGLEAQVEISVDRWGIPHIRAQNMDDLFFAQGFNAARDRLWQIDLWRKRGLGRLAEDFGPGFLAQDWASRLFLYRGDMDAEWAAYGPDARAICGAFARGINAYVDLVEAEPGRLPPEFAALGTRPSRWRAEDVVRVRTHGWMRNALSEVARANLLARGQADADRLRMRLEPPVDPHRAEGLDLGAIPLNALDLYKLAIAPVVFTEARLTAGIEDAWDWTSVMPAGEVVRMARPPVESNNWAVAGERTVSGRPILASDPHRSHALPSLRYLVHLTAPGLDAIGAGEPSFPGIAIGHNEHAAFGLTLFLGPDQEDVYVYEMDPAGADSYRYRGGWEPMQVVEEVFQVKGAAEQRLPMKFTRHGPVVYENAPARRAVAIRTVWSEPGTAPYGASLAAMRAANVDEFRQAMRVWRVPAVNQVYADRAGVIAWIAAGLSPVRRNWEGLLPVPGDGRYEWDGFLDPDRFPAVRNPAVGFVASANAKAPGTPDAMGHEWDDPSRLRRIGELLHARGKHSIGASCTMQNDVLSIPARRVCALLKPLVPDDEDGANALALLRGWDHELTAASGAGALFEVWWTCHMKAALFERLVPDVRARELIGPGDVESVLQALERPAERLGDPAGDARDRLLLETLANAFRDCVVRMGPNPEAWAWGWLHTCAFRHGVAAVAEQARAPGEDLGPFPVGGSESTLAKAVYRPSDFTVVMGASLRVVIDVGGWDQSLWISAPGQSGDPRSPHYADLAPFWARGEYVPMVYSREAVDEAEARRLVLTPVPRHRRARTSR